jgi:hypothetical protein
MLVGAHLLAASLASCSSPVVFRDEATVTSRSVTLGQIANLDTLPPSMKVEAATIHLFDFRPRQKQIRVTQSDLVSRARSLLPSLAPCLPRQQTGDVTISFGDARISPIFVRSTSGTGFKSGDKVATRLDAGIFSIEREGVAMQDGVPGARAFVRTRDGVLSALCCEGQP